MTDYTITTDAGTVTECQRVTVEGVEGYAVHGNAAEGFYPADDVTARATITSATATEYRKIRSATPWLPACQAIAWARGRARDLPPFEAAVVRNIGGGADAFEVPTAAPGVVAFVRVSPDYDADTSYLGEITGEWQPGAIPARTVGYLHGGAGVWYVPMNGLEEQREYLRRTHSKHDAYTTARDYVLRDGRRLAEGVEAYGVTVTLRTASEPHADLGSASLWGIDADTSDPDERAYFAEVASDLLHEAASDAASALPDLVESLTTAAGQIDALLA